MDSPYFGYYWNNPISFLCILKIIKIIWLVQLKNDTEHLEHHLWSYGDVPSLDFGWETILEKINEEFILIIVMNRTLFSYSIFNLLIQLRVQSRRHWLFFIILIPEAYQCKDLGFKFNQRKKANQILQYKRASEMTNFR